MKEELEIRGEWYLPCTTDSSELVHGTMRYSPGKGVMLELDGSFSTERWPIVIPFGPTEVGLILGKANTGEEVTLQNCMLRRQGTGNTDYDAELAFVGARFETPEEIVFGRLSVAYLGLAEWGYQSGFTAGFSADPFTVNIHYVHPGSRVLAECDRYTIALEVSASFDVRRHRVKESPYIEIALQRPLEWIECAKLIRRVKDFLTLAAQSPVVLESVTAYGRGVTDAAGDGPRQRETKIYFDEIRPPDVRTPSAHRMLFRLNDLPDDPAQSPLQRWMTLDSRLQRIVDLYFGEFYRPTNYIENRLLNLCQVLEGYHRYLCKSRPDRFAGAYEDDLAFREGVYAALAGAIPETVATEYRESLKGRLRYLNEYSLSRRLKQLIAESKEMVPEDLFANGERRKRFVREVVELRNRYVHVDDGGAVGSQGAEALLCVELRLRLIVTAWLLDEIGFGAEQIRALLTESRLFQSLQYVEAQSG